MGAVLIIVILKDPAQSGTDRDAAPKTDRQADSDIVEGDPECCPYRCAQRNSERHAFALCALIGHAQTRSMIVAVPMPAPTQSVTRAVSLSERSSSSTMVPSSMPIWLTQA